ncbi:MAG: ATP-binding cassette domain-containing protein [Rhodospirillales bacterium]|nr:ATP-binding cassette domain-containing protein [Rhodospirillales bacterium]
MLHIDNLSRPGLKPASFTLKGGECIALGGPSGAGKSLLLRAIADLDPNDGRVEIDGTSRRSIPAPQWRRMVCYLSAESGWWRDRVGDHFTETDAALALLPDLGLAPDTLDWQVSRLSTGERQRLALARVLLLKPRFLLLDEPTANLDPESTERVEGLIKDRLKDGVGILLTTHLAAQARRLATRQLMVEGGSLSEVAL